MTDGPSGSGDHEERPPAPGTTLPDPVRTEELCRRIVESLDLGGAAVAMITGSGERDLLHATDTVVAQLDELQFGLGEGPCLDAYRRGSPVLVDDLGSEWSTNRWPMFAREAVRAGAGAAFAFPLQAVDVCFGVVELYRDRPGALAQGAPGGGPTDAGPLGEVMAAVDVLARVALDDLMGNLSSEEISWRTRISPEHARVHQAAGMLAVRLGLPVPDAMARLRAAAYTRQLSLPRLAEQVVSGDAQLEKDTP